MNVETQNVIYSKLIAHNVKRLAVRCGLDITNFQLNTKVYE